MIGRLWADHMTLIHRVALKAGRTAFDKGCSTRVRSAFFTEHLQAPWMVTCCSPWAIYDLHSLGHTAHFCRL